LDARDARAFDSLISRARPEVIFFPAANANVDWCEDHPAEAEALNLDPLRTALVAAAEIPVVAYSSDYVFNGGEGPYSEEDLVTPLSVYGRLKVELERLVIAAGGTVIRSTGVFGWEPPPGRNFVLRLAASLRKGERVSVPNDQIATPTYVEDLAAASVELARDGVRGIWHVAGTDLLARDAFGRLVAEAFGLAGDLIEGVPTAALAQRAPRPLRGGLRCGRYQTHFGVAPVRSVRVALAELRAQLDVAA
jgi:dTDP-4-dehydrorhamnose reductase